MTSFLLYLLLWIWDNRSFDTITRSNDNKSEAEKAYIEKDYRRAAALYEKITNGSIFVVPASRLYLAHSYYQLDSLNKAEYHYKLLENVSDISIASRANTQLAIISLAKKDTVQGLEYLKTALKILPENNTARYNYELLKKTFSGKIPPQKKPDPTPQEAPPPPQPAPAEIQAVEIAEQREELLQRLRRLNMSEDQARSILDAMKTNEAQYIFQLRKRQYYNQSDRSKKIEW